MILGMLSFNFYLFYMLLFVYEENPGDLLVANSYMVQVGIFVFLFLGVLFERIEQKYEWNQLLQPIHSAYIKKVIGKLLFVIVVIISLFFIIFLMLSTLVLFICDSFSHFYI